jgi:heat shock protein HslJ
MPYKMLFISLLITSTLSATTLTLDDKQLNGNWHLRVIDGMEVRKARAIVEFSTQQMRIQGFDSCNRIDGKLHISSKYSASIPMIRSTRMACRTKIQNWVSKKLHEALKEGFYMKKETKYGVLGVTLKSASHELFFRKMGKKKL